MYCLLTMTRGVDRESKMGNMLANVLVIGVAGSMIVYSTRAGACEEHLIQKVSDHGHLVKLEDGSLWKIDARDAAKSVLWLQFAEVAVCDGRIIDEDAREEVRADRIN